MKMASNYNNYADKKPTNLNFAYQQSNMQTNTNNHNQVPMSDNLRAPWNSPTQQPQQPWQFPPSTPPRTNSTISGYMGSPMNSIKMNSNQQWPNTPPRSLPPHAILPNPGVNNSPVRSPYPPWSGSTPPRAIPPHVRMTMPTSPGSPTRTAPPSWPSTPPRAMPAFAVQPSTPPRAIPSFAVQPSATATNNTGIITGGVCLL